MTRRIALLALLLVGALAALPPAAGAGTPAQDLAWLNQKRADNGIPGDVTLNADWSAKCAQHLAYMRATNTVTHDEDPTSPHFTEGGNWAGTHAVLASTTPWTAETFIWETAPLHMAQLLAPQLSQIGIADDGQLVCVTTLPGYQRPAPATATVVTYPGNGRSIYPSESTAEWPMTPAEALGVPNPTGPNLYVFAWGPDTLAGTPITIAAATLRGPNGPVPVRWVDTANPIVGPYLTEGSGIIVPTRELRADARYVATVRFSNGAEHTWGFSTGIDAMVARLTQVRVVPRSIRRIRVCTLGTRDDCRRWSTTNVNTIRLSGRFTDIDQPHIGVSGAQVGVSFRGIEQALVPTTATGRFAATYRLISRSRRLTLTVTVRKGASFGAYVVRFRIVTRPDGRLVAQLLGTGPAPMARAPLR